MSWWTSRVEQTVTEDVPAPPDEVRDFFVDLDSLPLVHPLVESVTELSREELADGYRQRYRVVDRLRWGPFRFRVAYRVEWHVPEHGDVESEAVQSPGVRLRETVTFAPIETGTRVTQRLRIEAPRPLLRYTQREAVKAHVAMLAAISSHFAARR